MGLLLPTALHSDDAAAYAAGRRRPPTSKAERERRKEWGRKWGTIGAEWKRKQHGKGA